MRTLFTFIISVALFTVIAHAQSDLAPLAQFAGDCAVFHPDETAIATTHGLFALAAASPLIDRSADPVPERTWITFSSDGHWLLMGDTLYESTNGEVVLTLDDPRSFVAFSEDGAWLTANGIHYDTQTWQRVEQPDIADFTFFTGSDGTAYIWRDFTAGNGIPTTLSPQRTYWVHILEGIYDVASGDLLPLPDALNNASALEGASFSPDDTLFFPADDDSIAYTLPDFEPVEPPAPYPEAIVTLLASGSVEMALSPQRDRIALYPDGVFDTRSGEQIIALDPDTREISFNPDGTLFIVATFDQQVLIYGANSGDLLITLSGTNPIVSPDARYIAVTADAQSCDLYELPE